MPAKQGGRPRKAPGKEAVKVTLRAEHVAMIDDAIEARDGNLPDFIRDVANAKAETYDGRRQTVIAKRRREFLGELIEDHCSFEARHPVEIKVIAPLRIFGNAADVESAVAEVEAWQRAAAERLTAEAPESVKLALEWSALLRLGQKDPEALRRTLAGTLAAALAESESDDE